VITRRELLATLSAGLLAPAICWSQPRKVWRIGVLSSGSPASWDRDLWGIFVIQLSNLGYVERSNVMFERRFANSKWEDFAVLAADLVNSNVDVIVTRGTPAVQAAKLATERIPIVSASFSDPVGSGFAQSLARPGGNITGLSNLGEELYAKRLESLASVLPKANRVAWLINPANSATMSLIPGFMQAAAKTGKRITISKANTEEELEGAFTVLARERVGGLIISDDAILNGLAPQIAAIALRQKLPTAFANAPAVEEGGLMSYGTDKADMLRQTAVIVDKIFKGAKPGDLPIVQPTKFELAINMKTAKALGITIPKSVLLRADRVIE